MAPHKICLINEYGRKIPSLFHLLILILSLVVAFTLNVLYSQVELPPGRLFVRLPFSFCYHTLRILLLLLLFNDHPSIVELQVWSSRPHQTGPRSTRQAQKRTEGRIYVIPQIPFSSLLQKGCKSKPVLPREHSISTRVQVFDSTWDFRSSHLKMIF